MTLKEMLAQATPRPWRWRETDDGQCWVLGSDNLVFAMCNTGEPWSEKQKATAALIATAGNAFGTLVEEHREWAKLFGSALMLVLQGDYSEVRELAHDLPFDFPIGGMPILRSAALELARKEATQ